MWSPAGKALTSWLSFVMSNSEVVTFRLVSWVRQVRCLIVSIPDLCPLWFHFIVLRVCNHGKCKKYEICANAFLVLYTSRG